MAPSVQFRLVSGSVVELHPGDIVGRSRAAELRINDPRISEAHALVSLRGMTLRLLALRGRFTVGGRSVVDVVLAPDRTIQLADDVTLTVVDVALPETVLALETDAFERLIPPAVASIDSTTGEIRPGARPNAAAILWMDADRAHLRVPGAVDRELAAGDSFVVGGRHFKLVNATLGEAAIDTTEADPDNDLPLVIRARYDTVHVHRGTEVLTIDGVPARLLSELALMGVPVQWRTVAGVIWPDEQDDAALRHKWDAGLFRLRKRLREIGLRKDLVRADGLGNFELFLRRHDVIEDAT